MSFDFICNCRLKLIVFFFYKFSEFIDFVVHSTCSTESGVEIKDFVGGSYIF